MDTESTTPSPAAVQTGYLQAECTYLITHHGGHAIRAPIAKQLGDTDTIRGHRLVISGRGTVVTADAGGPMAPGPGSSSAFLDQWLKQRRAAKAVDELPEEPGSRFDINSLLPDETGIDDIQDGISRLVKGQQRQVREISVLLSMHLQWARLPDPLHQPPNAIALGPTGSGKTFTLQTAADLLRLPFISVDTTALVPSGIVGLQIEDILKDLVTLSNEILVAAHIPRSHDDDIALAERGIIVFDEFDKVATGERDSSDNLQVQRRLLKLCEGSQVPIGLRTHTSEATANARTISTRGILIVAAGAFEGIDRVKSKRPQSIARRAVDRERVFSVDIQHFGFIPELVARLPVLIQYGQLSKSDLVKILEDDDTSPLTVWRNYIASQGGELHISPEAIDRIADRALEAGLGARGLQQVIFPLLADAVSTHTGTPTTGVSLIKIEAEDVQ